MSIIGTILLLLYVTLASNPVAFFWGPCPCCGCPCTPATNFQVDIAGTTNGTCTNCATFDGTYFLTLSATTCAGVADPCVYKYSNITMTRSCTGIPCDGMCIQLNQDQPTDTTTVEIFGRSFVAGVGCSGYGGSGDGRFKKSWSGATKDCTVYSALDIPFLSNGSVACSFSGATCTVTQS